MNVRHLDGTGTTPSLRELASVVARRPTLWWPALRVATRFAPRGWWRRPPFLPVPDERYWRFRMETAFGDGDAVVSEEDLDAALRWARRSSQPRR